MRIKCKSYKAAEKLSHLFNESHIERRGDKCFLVVDKLKARKADAYA